MATIEESIHDYLEAARWFGGKGREFEVRGVHRLGEVGDADVQPRVVIDLVAVSYADPATGPAHELYQLPLALYAEPEARLDHAFVGWWQDPELDWQHAYDAVHDRAAMAKFLDAFGAEEVEGDRLRFELLGTHEIEADAHATLFSGEQSNSSVAYGEDAVLKVFRKLTHGENPDITTHRVLTEAGSTHVAHLYGWIEVSRTETSGVLHLAMLQQFLRTASDGWDLALASVRDLFAEGDLHANEAGGDFAAESARLGSALAEVHEQLREAFGVSSRPAAEIAKAMHERLDAAVAVVPDLAEHASRLHSTYDALAALGEVSVHRIHGDLHLGQTLRTVAGWKLVDFEGEPAKPLEERLLPDSPWRDIAGMLRSFDYAPHAVAEAVVADDANAAGQRDVRAQEWAARNKEAFLKSYAGGDLSAAEGRQVTAYVADKAVYECVYEARNRPSWLPIPLAAIARLGAP